MQTRVQDIRQGIVVCCPDKFRGSLDAREAAAAIASGVERAGRSALQLPLADGGEGTLDVLCPDASERRSARITGPLGTPVTAEWGVQGETAVVEMARASGLSLVNGTNDPLRATTAGTGELMRLALDEGAQRIIVAVGGSATTDGGRGALEALDYDLRGAHVVVACDVTTTFVDAARVFGPQKGADDETVAVLERRLATLAEELRTTYGVDVRSLPGSGAAGGLAGGLAAIGARLVPGATLVAELVGLREALSRASLAITGEGRFDATSLAGKVVGNVLDQGRTLGTAVAIIAGDAAREQLPRTATCITLVELAGSPEAAMRDAPRLLAEAAERLVSGAVEPPSQL